ncbi:hypothetical protein BH09VER1_BH09VER1_16900 [soil metagenome]
MKQLLLLLSGLVFTGLAATSPARDVFSDNFDSLDAGDSIISQGGWTDNSKTGSATVAHSMPAWSAPNYLDFESGGGVQHTFPAADFTSSDFTFSFYFKPDNAVTTGHNLQLSLRKGPGYLLYLNIRGALDALDLGIDSTSPEKKTFTGPLRKGTWYLFTATFDHASSQIAYSITDATTRASLLTGTLDLNPGPADRIVIGSTTSTTAGDWSFDTLSLISSP